MRFSDKFFKRVEEKTNVNKETILEMAQQLQKSNLKDEKTIRNLVQQLGTVAGKSVSKEKEDKIVDAILNDKVPKNVDKYI